MHDVKTRKELVRKIIKVLSRRWPDPKTPLIHKNLYELTVAVLLSAQMQDARLNTILPGVFQKFPDIHSLANANLEDIQQAIKSVNYYKNKAKYLKNMATQVVERFDGKIPLTVEELTSLPGIGVKTATAIISEHTKSNPGIVVDTHVARVAYRLGLTDATKPEKVKQDLESIVPRKYWRKFSLWLVFYGRYVCKAKNPDCGGCEFKDYCRFYTGK